MTDQERLALFAKFLGLKEPKLKKLATAQGLVSRTTFERIGDSNRKDKGHAKTRTFGKLAKFIDPEYLARPDLPNDPFIRSEAARRLRAIGWPAFELWHAFLTGENNDAPTWSSIERHWLMSCAHVPRLPVNDKAAGQAEHLERLVRQLERLGRHNGVIEGERAPGEFVRWSWAGSELDPSTWRRMRAAYYRAQLLIEHSADVIYLGTPVLSFSTSPCEIWQPRIGAGDDAGRELVHAYSDRWVRLQHALVQRRQSAVVMFAEQQTKKFFNTLDEEKCGAWAEHIGDLSKGNLTLLMTTLSESEERELCMSLTLGGKRPGLATADQLTVTTKPQRCALVTHATSREYKERRALFEDIWNSSSRTKRIDASALHDLVPKEGGARKHR